MKNFSKRKGEGIGFFLLAITIVCSLLFFETQRSDCANSGGTLVQGFFGFECIEECK